FSLLPALFFLLCAAALIYLLSFPTRRSSDLDAKLNERLLFPLETFRVGTDVRALDRVRKQQRVAPGAFGTRRASASGRNEIGVVDRKSTRLNSSHVSISYAVFCLKKKILVRG